jgi:hypothetical protein
LSWILRAFRVNLTREKEALEILLREGDVYRAFVLANSIAQATGRSFGLEMSLNYPAGQTMPNDVDLIGNRNVSIIVARGRKKFEKVPAEIVRAHAAKISENVRFEPVSFGYEGFNAITEGGRITVLPGAVYLWLPIDRRVEGFLDWLFTNGYGLSPPEG